MYSSSKKEGKKPRCFSAEKMAYKKQKKADRWSGMGKTKQQQVRLDAKLALEQERHAVAAAQQQVAAHQQQLIEECSQLQQTSRNKFREADAAKEQAQREWAMANSLITDEMGGGKLSRALALERRLVDTGYVNLPAARRAVTAKAAQDGVDQSRLSVLPEGLDVWHFDGDGRPAAAKITKVHHNDAVPYYTIAFDNKHERDTDRNRIVPM